MLRRRPRSTGISAFSMHRQVRPKPQVSLTVPTSHEPVVDHHQRRNQYSLACSYLCNHRIVWATLATGARRTCAAFSRTSRRRKPVWRDRAGHAADEQAEATDAHQRARPRSRADRPHEPDGNHGNSGCQHHQSTRTAPTPGTSRRRSSRRSESSRRLAATAEECQDSRQPEQHESGGGGTSPRRRCAAASSPPALGAQGGARRAVWRRGGLPDLAAANWVVFRRSPVSSELRGCRPPGAVACRR